MSCPRCLGVLCTPEEPCSATTRVRARRPRRGPSWDDVGPGSLVWLLHAGAEPVQVRVAGRSGAVLDIEVPAADGRVLLRRLRCDGGKGGLRLVKPEQCAECRGWGNHATTCPRRADRL